MLASMVHNPRPTRAEMTDVANAVFESADALMLGDETANGSFAAEAVETMASIARNAEEATNYYAVHSFSRDFSCKPFTTLEAAAASLARTAADTDVAAVLTCTENGNAAEVVIKFRPRVPHIVLTSKAHMAAAFGLYFGAVGLHMPSMAKNEEPAAQLRGALVHALAQARKRGAYAGGRIAVLHGSSGLAADEQCMLSILDPEPGLQTA